MSRVTSFIKLFVQVFQKIKSALLSLPVTECPLLLYSDWLLLFMEESAVPVVHFSTDGSDVINRDLSIQSQIHIENIDQYFEIQRSIDWIQENGFKQVKLFNFLDLLNIFLQVELYHTCSYIFFIRDNLAFTFWPSVSEGVTAVSWWVTGLFCQDCHQAQRGSWDWYIHFSWYLIWKVSKVLTLIIIINWL